MDSVTMMLREGFEGRNQSLAPLMLLAGLNQLATAEFLQVNVRTLHRWETTGRPDPTASKLLAVMAGFLPWPDWVGWEMHTGCLFAPGQHRRGMDASRIENMIIINELNDTLKRDNERLQAELDQARQRPKAAVLQLVKKTGHSSLVSRHYQHLS